MRVLVTGGGGFVGQWLARALLERGDDVVLGGLGSPEGSPRILSPSEWSDVQWRTMDLRDERAVNDVISTVEPELIVHLGGVSFPPDADIAPGLTYEVNALGVVRVLASVARFRSKFDPTILVVGSALQYGSHEAAEMPLGEDVEQRPLTIYAASKAAQEVAARQFHRASGLRVICTRSFNHSGVGHGSTFVLPSLARRVTDIARGRDSRVLRFGTDVVRDYLHVSDVVRAYLLLSERGTPGEVYNVCSGEGRSTSDLARMTLQRAGVEAEICTDPSLVRPNEIAVLIGSSAKLRRVTGWAPRCTCDDIIDDLLHAASN